MRILAFADIQRARVLGLLLSNLTIRKAFQSRAIRLGILFLVSLILATAVSIYLLPVALIFSPLIYGIPHLWASFRYVPYALGQRDSKFLKKSVVVAGAGLILGMDLLALHFNYQLGMGPTLLLFYVLGLAWLTAAHAWKFLLLLPLAPFYFYAPVATAAALIFAHNLVAFLFWYRAAGSARERAVALISLVALFAMSAVIASGLLDQALFFVPSNLEFPPEIVRAAANVVKIFGGEGTVRQSMRWLAIFALMQNMHYFVWLKALSEQHLPSENPASFARSFAKLRADYGAPLTYAAVASVAGFWIYALVNFSLARESYTYIAASHAFWEIAALPLVFLP